MKTPSEAESSAGVSWHGLTWEEAARSLETDSDKGLTEREARGRPAAGALEEIPAWRLAVALFARQWKGSVILILCAASLAFWMLGHRNDSLGIAFSVVFAVLLGFFTDFRSQRALAALKSLNAPSASVIRDGIMIEIPAGRVVVGDVVVLRGGCIVPADGRLFQASELKVQESALTGESAAVSKGTAAVAADAPLAERTNMAFAGTTALTGAGRMLVTAIGLDTELGRIGKLVQGYRKEETPLERQVEALGRRLGLLIVGLCLAATAMGLLLGQAVWEMLETGFLLAIAAIPEGLPAVNTVALAGGVRRMVRARAIVRRLSAVEVLGSVDVICTDKTGTLTENVMRVAVVCLPGRRLDVSGSGYAPEGRFADGTTEVDPRKAADLRRLLWIGALCNNAVLESHEGWHVHGLPTEGALLTLAAQGGIDAELARREQPRASEIAFTSARKRMSVVVADASGARWTLAKGAVGALLPLCDRVEADSAERPLTDAARAEMRREAERLGGQGLRVLGLAYRRVEASEDGDPEKNLVWAGMVGLLDPPRRNAAQAVKSLAGAGIRTIMVTGDQRDTASAIAARLGLPSGENGSRDAGELADILRRNAWDELERIVVFARVSPEDKLRLIEALKSRGHVVAMTGDGINDAPALKAADIGVAMGSSAADVAKEAADLVITDAEYATLTVAVEEGRRIYANLQRSTRYLLLCSLSNIGLMMGAIALRLPLAMTALQLLWLNLVIHIFPAIALAVAPNPRRFMEEPPRARAATLLGWPEIREIALRSLAISGAALVVFSTNYAENLELARTLAMTALGLSLLSQMFPALFPGRTLGENVRSADWSVWLALALSLAILAAMLYLPPLRELLATASLAPRQWIAPVAAALFCLGALGLVERFTLSRAVSDTSSQRR
jgi:Ca2+-transporting ATPase